MIIGSLIEFVLHPPLARCPTFDFSCHKQKGGEVFRFHLLLHLPLKQIGNFFQHGGRNTLICNLGEPSFVQEGFDLNLDVQRSRRDILPDLVQILFPQLLGFLFLPEVLFVGGILGGQFSFPLGLFRLQLFRSLAR